MAQPRETKLFSRPLPLRVRLALGYSAFFAAILVLLSLGVFLAVRQALLRDLSEQLQTSADLIQRDFDLRQTSLSAYFGGPIFSLPSGPTADDGLAEPVLYIQVLAPDGALVTRSANLGEAQLPLAADERARVLTGRALQSTRTVDATRVEILSRPLAADARIVGVLQVGRSLTEADRTLRLLLTSLLVTGGLSLVAAVRGGTWLARRALEPVAEIAATAQQIVRADDLSRRVRAVPINDEIGQLATTINDMLGRLDQLFTAQQRFVADLSHELRTPLAAMRGHLEMIRRGASHDPTVLAESLPALERETARLARMTSDLLTLAQAENGLRIQQARVALDELVLDVVRDLRPLSNGVALIPSIDEQVQVPGDPDRLKQALVNLVANALQHTRAGGTVRVALVRAGDYAELHVRDTGAGIAAEDLPHIFERFYRADKARTRRQGGAGLGLSIVKWVAEAHGGCVTVESAPGQGSTFTLALPLT